MRHSAGAKPPRSKCPSMRGQPRFLTQMDSSTCPETLPSPGSGPCSARTTAPRSSRLGWKLCSTGWICRSPSDLRARSPELVIIGCLASERPRCWVGSHSAASWLPRDFGVVSGAAGLVGRADRGRRGRHCGRYRGADGQEEGGRGGPLAPTDTVQSVKKDVEEIRRVPADSSTTPQRAL